MTTKKVLACLVAAGFLAVFVLALPHGRAIPKAGPAAPGAALWRGRTLEVLIQGAILLAGVLGILALVGGPRGKEEAA